GGVVAVQEQDRRALDCLLDALEALRPAGPLAEESDRDLPVESTAAGHDPGVARRDGAVRVDARPARRPGQGPTQRPGLPVRPLPRAKTHRFPSSVKRPNDSPAGLPAAYSYATYAILS